MATIVEAPPKPLRFAPLVAFVALSAILIGLNQVFGTDFAHEAKVESLTAPDTATQDGLNAHRQRLEEFPAE